MMSIAKLIDHTLLKPDVLIKDIIQLCQDAQNKGFAAVCVPPYFVRDCFKLLEDDPVKVCTVIGFPMGYSTTPAKVDEIKRAIDDGADEVDAVLNILAVKNGQWNYVQNDISSMLTATRIRGKILKLIIEIGLLNQAEIVKVCEICANENIDFVKTSTGINGTGATPDHIKKLRKLLPNNIKIKASGGITTAEQARLLVEAGANRIGSSKSLSLIQ
jgi:deoxyribose-phosphate aldolase